MTSDQLIAENERLTAELTRLRGSSNTWPLADVLEKLREAASILLDDKSYDGHGHELIRYAEREAVGYIAEARRLAQGASRDQ